MRLVYNKFEGMAPRVDPAGMARGLAAKAVNAGFSRGVLSPLPIAFNTITENDLIGDVIGSQYAANGLYYSHMANAWFLWSDTIGGAVDSLIAPQDEYDRIYFAGSAGPRFMTSNQYTKNATNINRTSYQLGIPYPTGVVEAHLNSETIPEDVADDEVVRQRVSYVFTLVDEFGHEGPPSTPSNDLEVPVEYPFEARVVLPVGDADTSGRALNSNARKFIYRSAEGTDSSAYLYVGQVGFGQGEFIDTVEYGNESEAIPSINWYEPPAEIKNLAAVASNFLAGFYGNMLCYSDVKLPHAWPTTYRFPLKYQIVAIRSTANGLFIGTTGKPYWAFGADPEAAIPQELNDEYPCVNAEGVVDAGGFIVYPSHDGLVGIDGQETRLLTSELFDRIDWQALDPYNMRVWAYEGKVMFYSPTTSEVYALEVGNPRTLTLLDSDGSTTPFDNVTAIARDARHDRTIMALSAGGFLEVVNAADSHVEWESWEQLLPPLAFYFVSVMATKYPVTLTLRSDRNDTLRIDVLNERPLRLPKLAKSRRWATAIEFDGQSVADNVNSVIIAQTTQELNHGA